MIGFLLNLLSLCGKIRQLTLAAQLLPILVEKMMKCAAKRTGELAETDATSASLGSSELQEVGATDAKKVRAFLQSADFSEVNYRHCPNAT